MKRLPKQSWLVAFAFLLAACGEKPADQPPVESAQQPAAGVDSVGGMAGMGGTAGMSGMQMGGQMMANMDEVMAMHGDSLMQMVPDHGHVLGGMMDQMNNEMKGMNKAADPKWTALADSLRDDMAKMSGMSAAEMESFMAIHRGRMSRLMEMHGSMMGGM